MTSILVATDGSISAERAVHIGADIAKSRRADVVLLSVIDDQPIPEPIKVMAETEHVVDRPPNTHSAHIANIPSWMMEGVNAAAQAEERIQLRQAMADLAIEKAQTILGEAGITATSVHVTEGDAVQTIIQTAAREHAEMIIMGTRGLGAMRSLIFGSTSKRVAEQATCSCITVT